MADDVIFDILGGRVKPLNDVGMAVLDGILAFPELGDKMLVLPLLLGGCAQRSLLGMAHTMLKTLVSTHLKTQVAKQL